HEVGVDENGLLKRAGGELIDTTGARAAALKDSEAGRNIFALDRDQVNGQKLYAADTKAELDASKERAIAAHVRGDGAVIDHVHHSSFTGGQEVDGAGDMKVTQGFLQTLSNASGHYVPDATSNLQTLKALQRMGANLDTTMVETKVGDQEAPVKPFRALAAMASEYDFELMDSHHA